MAASLGVSRQAVFKWEKGQARPDTKNLIGLSQLLGVSMDFLTSGVQIEDTTPLSVLPLRWVSTVLLLVTLLFLVDAWILALVAHYMNQK